MDVAGNNKPLRNGPRNFTSMFEMDRKEKVENEFGDGASWLWILTMLPKFSTQRSLFPDLTQLLNAKFPVKGGV